MYPPEDLNDCCFAPDSKTNGLRGPTDKQSDADPFQESLRAKIESRVGKATDDMSGMKLPSD